MLDKAKNAASNIGGLGDLKRYVEGIDFPASKDEIVSHLRESGAQDDLIAKVREVGKQQFDSKSDLLSSVTGG